VPKIMDVLKATRAHGESRTGDAFGLDGPTLGSTRAPAAVHNAGWHNAARNMLEPGKNSPPASFDSAIGKMVGWTGSFVLHRRAVRIPESAAVDENQTAEPPAVSIASSEVRVFATVLLRKNCPETYRLPRFDRAGKMHNRVPQCREIERINQRAFPARKIGDD